MKDFKIKVAVTSDEREVISAIALAFSNDPVARWSIPDPRHYLDAMPTLARAFGGRGFATGTIHLVEGGLGAAMWLPPGGEPDYEAMMELLGSFTPPEALAEMMEVLDAMGSFHPKEPHWYLPLIGVDPLHQGKGAGTALMRFALERIDAAKEVAYLEPVAR